jgi:curved DNA-binding protein CbpA
MSKAELFTELTHLIDVDPFALIGVSVSADEKRIAKRYRQIAKQLHPDALAGDLAGDLSGALAGDLSGAYSGSMEHEIAAQVIARIVNPSYQKLKQEKSRQEMLSTIRLRVRRLVRTEKLLPTFQSGQQLVEVADESVDIFYEQTLSALAECQFRSLGDLHTHSLEIGQLNLIFLSRKLENLVIRSKRAGLMTATVIPTAATATAMAANHERAGSEEATQLPLANPEINYVQKHTVRAKTYLAQQNYDAAVQELREALKIAAKSPELHSMIGQVYYKQKLSGMAKTHFRQALKLKPDHKTALKYSELLGMSAESATPFQPTPQASEAAPQKPWLGRLLRR